MATYFVEPVVDQIISMLNNVTTGVNARFDTVDSAWDDGIVLDDVKRVFKGGIKIGSEVPCLVVWPEVIARSDENTNETIQFRPVIIVWAIVKGDDPEDAHVRMWRTLEAVFLCIKASENLSNEVDICNCTGFRYDSPWAYLEDDGYLAVGGVEFTIETEENW